ncbi:class I adenylate-forming enzyme family protein [Actinophytocola sp.]|uniref:class I adenylate-forming enzyme family protein n=1 Tax=Actinophytocola sp. TaxID=1872138 RepID=UPI002D7EC5D1|nr:AMP-binding protein [Actinophytocola sp.]HET9138028.1 AMP-binding protein [Actinophytocola sp.]
MVEQEGRPGYVLRLLDLFAEFGDRDAIVGIGWEGRFSYTQARQTVLDFAARLRDGEYRPGMTVAVVVAHPPEASLLQFALHLLGCRTAWVQADMPRRDIDDYLALARPDRVIYDTRTRHGKVGAALAEGLGVPAHCLGPGGLGPDLLAPAADTAPFDLETVRGAPEAIFQTTGTTGIAKLIRHGAGLYDQMLELAEDWARTEDTQLRQFVLTPMWHAAGQAITMLTLGSGGVLYVLFQFIAPEYLAAIAEHRPTSIHVSPLMLTEMLDHPDFDTTDLSSLELINVGGAAVAPARLREMCRRLGPVVQIAYGLSELPYIASYRGIAEDPEHPNRLGSCGPPYGDVRVEIRDDAGTVLPAGQVGEVWAHSRLAFLGYLGRPELTEESLVDGWVRTLDHGYLDEGGYLHLVGRRQDMIVTGLGGDRIFPRLIEEELATHPAVRAAVVIGVPHDDLGESAHAFVLTNDNAVTADELSALVHERLGRMSVPQSYDFVDDLPRTPNGKVDVKRLKAGWHAAHTPARSG